MIIVFLGPPGAGKGTQADILHDNHDFFHFDTGSRLRAEVASGSELGKQIASFIDRGKLVSIDIIRDLIISFMRQTDAQRIMFDGFPRNLEQAQVLDSGMQELGLKLKHAIYLEIDEDSLSERIVNRRFCSKCGEIYNLISKPPRQAGVCDADGAPLLQRSDDTAEVFNTRLKIYLDQTKPVLDFYRKQGILSAVDGDHDITDVATAIQHVLGNK